MGEGSLGFLWRQNVFPDRREDPKIWSIFFIANHSLGLILILPLSPCPYCKAQHSGNYQMNAKGEVILNLGSLEMSLQAKLWSWEELVIPGNHGRLFGGWYPALFLVLALVCSAQEQTCQMTSVRRTYPASFQPPLLSLQPSCSQPLSGWTDVVIVYPIHVFFLWWGCLLWHLPGILRKRSG